MELAGAAPASAAAVAVTSNLNQPLVEEADFESARSVAGLRACAGPRATPLIPILRCAEAPNSPATQIVRWVDRMDHEGLEPSSREVASAPFSRLPPVVALAPPLGCDPSARSERECAAC